MGWVEGQEVDSSGVASTTTLQCLTSFWCSCVLTMTLQCLTSCVLTTTLQCGSLHSVFFFLLSGAMS